MSLSKPAIAPRVVATSVYDWERYTLGYYAKGALAGGLCCGITHGALTPVDVVKTRMQLSPEIYNKGMVDGFKKVIAQEGSGALLTGLAPTCVGYFIQGAPALSILISIYPAAISLRKINCLTAPLSLSPLSHRRRLQVRRRGGL